jgi:chemotaxis protein MotB
MSSAPRGGDNGDHSSNDRWLVSYADFITLMFAFFAVLYATSQKDVEKSKEFQDSIKKYLVKAGAFGESGQQMAQGVKGNTPIEPPIQSYSPNKPETVKTLDEAEDFVDQGLNKEERKKYILDVTADDWGVRIVLPSAALFSPHSEKFRAEALPFLAKLSGVMGKSKRKILIEGHAAPGETGTFRSPWDFASARAVNLLRFVAKKENMPEASMAAASLGDSRPVFEGDKAAQNSRVEVILLNSDYEL